MSARALKRRLERLATQNEATIDADKRFFERWPDRTHRVRSASAAEAEISLLMNGVAASPGARLFVAVHKVADGARLRALFFGPAGNAAALDDIGEAEAARLYERVARSNPKFAEIESTTRALAASGGAG